MHALSLGFDTHARKALKLCEHILKHENASLSSKDWIKIKALTANNLGCLYKK